MSKYYKKHVTSSWLEQNHFQYSKIFTTDDCNAYTLRFPCFKWSMYAVLDCEVTVWENGKVDINVYDSGYGRARYAPWYLNSETHQELLQIIDKNIEVKLLKMGIKKCK